MLVVLLMEMCSVMLGSKWTWVLLALGVEIVRMMMVLTAVVGYNARLTLRAVEANASGAGLQPREQAAATVTHLRQLLMVLIPTWTSALLQAAELRIRSPVVLSSTLRRPQMQYRTPAPLHDVAYHIGVHAQAVPHDEVQHLLVSPWWGFLVGLVVTPAVPVSGLAL
jgi:hypothetical protein